MDRTRGLQTGLICGIVWGQKMGFYSKGIRFEGWRENNKIGLNRTGKSCRLRWVNYLHPGLKHGKMTPQEQRLVMELHSKWGNRWSRIARKLPGRTDNEIKNYWRTQMRKQKAQEKKHAPSSTTQSLSPTSSSSQSSLSSNNNHSVVDYAGEESFYDTGGVNIMGGGSIGSTNNLLGAEQQGYYYSMDDIWKDIAISEQNILCDGHPIMHSPSSWDHYSSDTLWVMDEEESKMLFPTSDQY